jgi:HTH-type transcriptional regulator/antitoxin HigA
MDVRTPAETFPPGDYLREELEARGWSQTEFAEIIGKPVRTVNEIIAGRRQVTPETATAIAAALGTSPQFWMNLETAYQLSRVDPAPERIGREARLRERFPVREMIKRGWVDASGTYEVLETRVFEFFGISDMEQEVRFSHAARRNRDEGLSMLQLAWLLRAERLASALQVSRYSEAQLRSALPRLEALTTEPEEARHVARLLAECGVRFVVVEPIPGSKIEGVCFWINEGKSPVIALTLSRDRIDNFWFNLRHEIEHVLRGDGKNRPVLDEEPNDDDEAAVADEESEEEKAANEAAANFCVPTKLMRDFIARLHPMYSNERLIGFSKIVRRHPGIVAGQLQKQINRYNLFRGFQVKIRHIVVQTALTDGYGRPSPVVV